VHACAVGGVERRGVNFLESGIFGGNLWIQTPPNRNRPPFPSSSRSNSESPRPASSSHLATTHLPLAPPLSSPSSRPRIFIPLIFLLPFFRLTPLFLPLHGTTSTILGEGFCYCYTGCCIKLTIYTHTCTILYSTPHPSVCPICTVVPYVRCNITAF
jgi:hypothetical protein